ncbi:hypothetical protein DFH11DRAFT_1631936 [Phellopilus nigrolimitatus]|nr:hypothetical protein DFH11DRAFT_1631936 [Phellopilus nigrolimitatus]
MYLYQPHRLLFSLFLFLFLFPCCCYTIGVPSPPPPRLLARSLASHCLKLSASGSVSLCLSLTVRPAFAFAFAFACSTPHKLNMSSALLMSLSKSNIESRFFIVSLPFVSFCFFEQSWPREANIHARASRSASAAWLTVCSSREGGVEVYEQACVYV